MRLFHVSEEADIKIFEPRVPKRNDLDKNVGLVWAINEECLPNFLLPRECPRVCYRIGKTTTKEDIDKFFNNNIVKHTVIIEREWWEIIAKTKLYLYEFAVEEFELQDEIAGYYISNTTQKPIAKYVIDDLFEALSQRNVEIKAVDELHGIANKVKNSTLYWSLCRMRNAKVL